MWRKICAYSRRAAFASLLSVTGLCIGMATAEAPTEYQVKAAFLLNFTKFVAWPATAFPGPEAPLTICILGDDPFGPALDEMVQGERADEHKVVVRRIRSKPDGRCQVLFVGESERDVRGVLASAGPDVLTVGDSPDFLLEGGMIRFVVENRRVRFDINKRAAAEAGLRLSSKLLNVARSVSN